ncbi:MAG: pyridoxal-phosphate dependent enzyme [Candidatus Eisenbacteria bacterium]|uniref:Pyridoxal-phosphate dependent enzyme n=1 Tax=Eiseniibacteriota bacterium TaxID=2212470 RepID=A0A9D6LBA4_UNCEI|nr:pyridoxal-phosphate dependent enzyme [Candidatus Eisenbacteria bacterium]MBI3540400.1 pyridoxal-phosphate dependent enzyme [Candidatus Eisenbacteria bacterium]
MLEGVDYHETILETIGRTPLVRIRKLAAGVSCPVLAKLEMFNPGGSVKDRIGLTMVAAAEQDGRLKPGGTIVECTSGNTGLGLAMVAAIKGYRAVLCMPDKVSSEKVNLLKAFGAEVHLSPTAVAPDSPLSYYSVAKRIAAERGGFLANQYDNPANPEAHYRGTGPELWEQTAGKITHFVAGMGTGGTISGVARYLKEKNPSVRVIGADPVGSILKHFHETHEMSEPHTYKIEGVGEDFIPGTTDFSVVDEVVQCTDRDGLNTARRLAREEALFTGGSGGMAAWVALEVARRLPAESLVVVLLPDTGERYLSKVHNDEWMRDNHLLDTSGALVKDLIGIKSGAVPRLLSMQADEPLKRAVHIVEQHNITQIPVFRNGELAGTLFDSDILRAALADPTALEKPIAPLLAEPLPVVASGDTVERVTKLLAARSPAVLVRDEGAYVGILTRFDMLQFIAGGE